MKINPVYYDHLDVDNTIQIYFGGASSGKSFYILGQRVILQMLQGGRNFLITRATAASIRKSCFNEVVKSIYENDLGKWFNINKSEMVITCRNGYQIFFCGLDNDAERLKSITPMKGVITDIIVEEATETTKKAYQQLIKRLRGGSNSTKKHLIMMFNPIYKTHWIYQEFFLGNWDDDDTAKEIPEKDLFILKTTYLDNCFLTADDKKRIDEETDPYMKNVYNLGNWGVLGKTCFTKWRIEDLSEYKFDRYWNGLDFGFADDPAAVARMSYNSAKRELYILDEIYASDLDNEQLAQLVKEKINRELITCDSSEPKSIAELKKYGVWAVGAKKGPGSIETSYKFLQKLTIIVDRRCKNTINELSIHSWKKDKDGNSLPIPEDKNNHMIDAIRYGIESEILNTRATSANIDI